MNSTSLKEFLNHEKNRDERADKDQKSKKEPETKLSAAGIWKKIDGVTMNNLPICPIMIHISPMSSANPTPFIFTLGACHVLATLIFLDWNIALRTLLGFNANRPFLKQFGLLLFACQILMPRNDALKAKVLFAILTGNLRCLFRGRFNYHILAFGIRAELLQIAAHNLLISFELFKLLKRFGITDNFDKFV